MTLSISGGKMDLVAVRSGKGGGGSGGGGGDGALKGASGDVP